LSRAALALLPPVEADPVPPAEWVSDGVVRIPLSRGAHALVDLADYPLVAGRKWHLHTKGYAGHSFRLPGGRSLFVSMHQVLVAAGPGQLVDHRNGNGLDNRRANLRLTDRVGNARNITRSKNQKRGGFKGVTWNKRARKWEAGINVAKKRRYLGVFKDPADAARAYDAAALQHFGEFASLNFPALEVAS
jgi:hypothetical protein